MYHSCASVDKIGLSTVMLVAPGGTARGVLFEASCVSVVPGEESGAAP